jgi:predicted PurR-regulated permease PerM
MFLLMACLIVLVIFLIVLVVKALGTLKSVNQILEDAKPIASVANKRVNEVDGLLDDMTTSMGGVKNALHGNENLVQSLSSVGKAVSSLVGMLKKTD